MRSSVPLANIRHRLFFALVPPPLVARRMAHWAENRFGQHGAFVRADRLHVTLDILDDFDAFPREMAERLVEVAGTVAADPFMIELDQISGGGGSVALRPRLRNAALQHLAMGIVHARQSAGIPPRDGYRFNPHITLMYRENAPFNETVAPFAWQVREFVLIHSLLGQTQHIPLGSWPLSGANHNQLNLF
jgi:RNA 2',3'-cyclic 3'-phosphodiesterase